MDARVSEFSRALREASVRTEKMRANGRGRDTLLSLPVLDLSDQLALTEAELNTYSDELAVAEEELREQADELVHTRIVLENEHDRYRDLFENAPDAYVVTDLQGVVREANSRASAFFNVPVEFVVGKPLLNFVARQDTRRFRSTVPAIVASVQVEEISVRLRPRHRSPIQASVTASPVRQSNARAIGIRWLIRPAQDEAAKLCLVTELAKSREALGTKQELIATMAHEMRNALNAVLGWTELLAQSSTSAEMRDRAIGSIRESTRMQASMLTELIENARLEVGNIEIEHRPFEWMTLVLQSLDAVRPSALTKQVGLTFESNDASVCTIQGDPRRLEQALSNILTNAIKFTPSGGQVNVALDVDETFARVRVRDTGKGIEANLLPHIFEPYKQGSRKGSGLGLGLMLAKRFVELHGGRIVARSDGEGKGSEFEIALPRSQPS